MSNKTTHHDRNLLSTARKTELEKDLIIKQAAMIKLERGINLPKSYGEALLEAGRLAIANEKLEIENQQQAAKIAKDASKVTLADNALFDREKQYSITDTGKMLGIPQKEFMDILEELHFFTKRGVPTQRILDHGFMDTKNNRSSIQGVFTMWNIYRFIQRYPNIPRKQPDFLAKPTQPDLFGNLI